MRLTAQRRFNKLLQCRLRASFHCVLTLETIGVAKLVPCTVSVSDPNTLPCSLVKVRAVEATFDPAAEIRIDAPGLLNGTLLMLKVEISA